jgi:hypothetical protein
MQRKYTKAKWTAEEREKVQELYWAIARPQKKHNGHGSLDAWKAYLDHFADKFLLAFPGRPKKEVVAKVTHLLQTRQLKEHGESTYWSDVHQGAVRSRKARPPTTF